MLERVAELRIQEALAQGQFDNLPGSGRPLDSALEASGDMWWLIRFNERKRLDNSLSEMDAALELEWKLRHILAMRDENGARAQLEMINARIRERNQDRASRGEKPISPIHIDSVMAQWRALHRPR